MLREPGSYFTRCLAFLDAGVLMLAQVHRLCNAVLINAGIGSGSCSTVSSEKDRSFSVGGSSEGIAR